MHYWNAEERKENKEKYSSVPFDPRFPSTNQSKRCWVNYVDFWKCANAKGEDSEVCQQFKYNYTELCPNIWVEAWNDQRSEGRFPVREVNSVEPKF